MAMTEIAQTGSEPSGDVARSRFIGITPVRLFDVTVAGLLALAFSPLIVLVLLAIWLESGRPFLFTQLRLGQNGKVFRMFKFRKFRPTQSDNGCPLTVRNDARMTAVGRFLEKSKFDELPQLWNVLRGDMALVGPRPESPPFADCFENGLSQVLEFRPGIMGPSQAFFRGESSLYPQGVDPVEYYRAVLFPLKAEIDLAYYPGATLASNIGWIVRCVLAIFGLHAVCSPRFATRINSQCVAGTMTGRRIADLVKLLVAEREAQVKFGAKRLRLSRGASVLPAASPSFLFTAQSSAAVPSPTRAARRVG